MIGDYQTFWPKAEIYYVITNFASPPAALSPPDKISQKSFNFLRSDQAYTHQNVTMKRKLDANDVPAPKAKVAEDKELDFEALNLDPRLRQALIKEKFTKPTLVQSKAIPLALEGKDILGMLTRLNCEAHFR